MEKTQAISHPNDIYGNMKVAAKLLILLKQCNCLLDVIIRLLCHSRPRMQFMFRRYGR